MRLGSFRQRRPPFAKLNAPGFKVHSFPQQSNEKNFDVSGCGPSAFYMITGKEMPRKFRPTSLQKVSHYEKDPVTGKEVVRYKYERIPRTDVPEKYMVAALRHFGYHVYPLSISTLTSAQNSNQITSDHVLLARQSMFRGVASWSIVHQDQIHHVFQTVKLHHMEFFCRPAIDLYLLFHRSWAKTAPSKIPKDEKFLIGRGEYVPGDMRNPIMTGSFFTTPSEAFDPGCSD